jgi:signal transduction histidine kinase
MSTQALGELTLKHLERLSRELKSDLAAVEQVLAELEADGVVKQSKVQELAAILHILTSEPDNRVIKDSAASSSKSVQSYTGKAALDKLKTIMTDMGDDFLYLDHARGNIDLYTGLRSRLMDLTNALQLVTLTIQKQTDEQGESKTAPSVKLASLEAAPGSKLGRGPSAIIRSQEFERQRIAREIHDGPAQAIANVVLRMDILSKVFEKDPSKAPAEIARMKEIAQNALDEIRGFIFDLRPMTLQDLGLVATIKRVVNSIRELSGIDTRIVVEGEERPLGQLVSLAVFRIAQEAMNNLRKYSKCHLAWIHLKFLKDKVALVVEDDGVGFDVDNVSNNQREYLSFGLLGMKERADDINAELEITSVPGHGTKVVLIVPTEDNPAMTVDVDKPKAK